MWTRSSKRRDPPFKQKQAHLSREEAGQGPGSVLETSPLDCFALGDLWTQKSLYSMIVKISTLETSRNFLHEAYRPAKQPIQPFENCCSIFKKCKHPFVYTPLQTSPQCCQNSSKQKSAHRSPALTKALVDQGQRQGQGRQG